MIPWELILAGIPVLGGGGIVGWWKATQPRRERARAADDAILGEPAVLDRSGQEMDPGKPGIVHRVSEVEAAVKTLTELVADQHELRQTVEGHDRRIGVLEDARLERLVTQAESAQAWRAVADKDIE